MDTLQAMRVFVRIVEAGSLTRAADSSGMSMPTVSKLLQTLEHHLGCKLLNRTTRKVSLTEDGHAYYQRCVAVISEIDDMEASLSQAKVAPKGRLKVNLPSALARHLLIPALPDFVALYPDIHVELGLTDRQVDVVGEGVDCVLRVGVLSDSGLVAKRVGSITTCVCGTPEYLARYGTPTTIADLDRHVGINYVSKATGRSQMWEFFVDGETTSVAMRGPVSVNDADAYMACVLAGLGLGKTGRYMIEPYLRDGHLKEVLQPFKAIPRPVSILYVPNRHQTQKLKVFIEWITALFAQHPGLQGKVS
ncbi:LysR family transcriptional regulator [Paraburkholderia saeva]|uniref:HTH-type transcriptional regulator PgrR n=1 Tax=Paraburkholderia saeva TaxID=2777537 RepID=A0A9N8S1K9_9BURK|nr:LysR family transcriptional regulator [Paraburkholderia saeva]CAG4889596.1 HTH-type transcriptional regulator PgrR [Paraburkholderia saeva]CAG4894819.1 HTH-type transcriptional regulator PgrR [Paraburkholderia saeva]CAG4918336.1 HTH-type transcriptional regulator PgrR [Paraburkholderia saeva]